MRAKSVGSMPAWASSAMAAQLLLLCLCIGQARALQKVAIVGAGVGGGMSAAFLREQLRPGERVATDVFEASDRVGGRTLPFHWQNQTIEMGASILWEQNQYMRDWADKLGLQRKSVSDTSDDTFAIFDGQRFVFNESSWTVVTLWRLVRRYGFQYFRFKPLPQALGAQFQRLYTQDVAKQGHATPRGLLEAANIHDLTQRSFEAEVQSRLGNSPAAQRLQDELLASVGRVNYNQDRLNALAGMVSMLPTADPRLFAIEGGNAQVVARQLVHANASLHLGSRVTAVQRHANGSFTLQLAQPTQPECKAAAEVYDAVILAVPLELSGIQLLGVGQLDLPARSYQRVVTTVVSSSGLRPSYFGVQRLPGRQIFTSKGAKTPFSVISPLAIKPVEGHQLYKLFSHAPLSPKLLSSIFEGPAIVATRDWLAYPVFNPPEHFAPFQLADGLVYLNAWENAASAMEMSSVAAANGAALVLQQLRTQGDRAQLLSRQHSTLVVHDEA